MTLKDRGGSVLASRFVALVEDADRGDRAGVAPAMLQDVERLTVHLGLEAV